MAKHTDFRTGRILDHDMVCKAIASGHTAHEIADMLDINSETIRKFARKRGLKIVPQNLDMANHPSWKGGETVDRSGYLLRRVSIHGPHGYLVRAIAKRGDSNGYAPVHRIVMHDQLGRELVKGEVVDHIDHDVKNNDPTNLRVFSSNTEHLRVTLKGRVPNWTPEGFARITGRPPKDRES